MAPATQNGRINAGVAIRYSSAYALSCRAWSQDQTLACAATMSTVGLRLGAGRLIGHRPGLAHCLYRLLHRQEPGRLGAFMEGKDERGTAHPPSNYYRYLFERE